MLNVGARWFGIVLLCSSPALSQINPNQIAVLKWYPADTTTTFAVGHAPWAAAFDGSSIWVTNFPDATVSNLRASDGQRLGTFKTGKGPTAMAFDGEDILDRHFRKQFSQ
jgi:DNA-binding beta-propeller fold protein YncE